MPGGILLSGPPTAPDWLLNSEDTFVGAKTPNGIRYAVLFDGYREQYARDANQITAWLRCRWTDRAAFRQEMVGWTRWRGGTYLDRFLAVACPFSAGDPINWLRCESLESKKKGCDPNVPLLDIINGNWLQCGWVVFEAIFRRPPYIVQPDDDFNGTGPNTKKEYERYTSLRRQFSARERRIPGLQFETAEVTPQLIADVGFVPDVTETFYLTWWQIPAEALPDARIAKCLNTVNSVDFPLPLGNLDTLGNPGTFIAPASSLLFRGLAQPIDAYTGADGKLYFDPIFVWDFRPTYTGASPGPGDNPFGWNGYRKNNGTYVRLRYKGSASGTSPGTPPYPSTDHKSMFIPGNP